MAIRIRGVYDLPDSRKPGPLKAVRVVEFTVDEQGPLFVHIPTEEWSPARARELIEAEAATVRALLSGG